MKKYLSVVVSLVAVAVLVGIAATAVGASLSALNAYCSDSGGTTDSGARHVNAALRVALRSVADTEDDEGDWIDDFLCDIRVTDMALATCAFFLVVIGAWQGMLLSRAVAASRDAARAAQRSAEATRLLVERLTARGGGDDGIGSQDE